MLIAYFLIHSRGTYTPGNSPALSLLVGTTNRSVFEMYNNSDFENLIKKISPKDRTASGNEMDTPARYIADFDYPLTIFLVFAILCALESHHNK